jgi:hypothetical protein
MADDMFLRQFSKGFSGVPKDSDGNCLGGYPDQDYIDRWYQLQKHVKEYSVSIGSVSLNASDVACILQQSAATIRLSDPTEVKALGQSLIAAADQMTAAPVNPATPVGTTNHASSSFCF